MKPDYKFPSQNKIVHLEIDGFKDPKKTFVGGLVTGILVGAFLEALFVYVVLL